MYRLVTSAVAVDWQLEVKHDELGHHCAQSQLRRDWHARWGERSRRIFIALALSNGFNNLSLDAVGSSNEVTINQTQLERCR